MSTDQNTRQELVTDATYRVDAEAAHQETSGEERQSPHALHICNDDHVCTVGCRHWPVESWQWEKDMDAAKIEHMTDCQATATGLMNEFGAVMVANDRCGRLTCITCAPYELARYNAHVEHLFEENEGVWYVRVEANDVGKGRRLVNDRVRDKSDTARLVSIATRDPALHAFHSELLVGQWKSDPRQYHHLGPEAAFKLFRHIVKPWNLLSGSDADATSSNQCGACEECREWWRAEHERQGRKPGSSGTPICTHNTSWQLPTRHRKDNDSEFDWEGVAIWNVAPSVVEEFKEEVDEMFGEDRHRLMGDMRELRAEHGPDADASDILRSLSNLRREVKRMGYERWIEEVEDYR